MILLLSDALLRGEVVLLLAANLRRIVTSTFMISMLSAYASARSHHEVFVYRQQAFP